MENPSLLSAVGKLAIAGEQAGFTLEQMIELLNEGLSVENLLDLISWRLAETETPLASRARSSGRDRVAEAHSWADYGQGTP